MRTTPSGNSGGKSSMYRWLSCQPQRTMQASPDRTTLGAQRASSRADSGCRGPDDQKWSGTEIGTRSERTLGAPTRGTHSECQQALRNESRATSFALIGPTPLEIRQTWASPGRLIGRPKPVYPMSMSGRVDSTGGHPHWPSSAQAGPKSAKVDARVGPTSADAGRELGNFGPIGAGFGQVGADSI